MKEKKSTWAAPSMSRRRHLVQHSNDPMLGGSIGSPRPGEILEASAPSFFPEALDAAAGTFDPGIGGGVDQGSNVWGPAGGNAGIPLALDAGINPGALSVEADFSLGIFGHVNTASYASSGGPVSGA
ncbi:hypothetical protein M406DRAFT_355167 [Cryphonectria parasitica EP155]|uniref:Uncharacterized protein n=1 Tax=Cryphonectria parasitica (strain ATCC 38755 / EP155) TaxID=660469 RepID=A0A9P4Y9S3_CRYP1|nr:uncharacterized protein M406DRAFT_355167 [Cryphonectria parasitica EP155]KAF3769106.1 hypothetical protein M406DRAFT_355167 [Cryphonectria parasitica EP155]